MLTWNSLNNCYEGPLEDGRILSVDGDFFAEDRTRMIADLVAEGKDEDEAYEQVTNDLLKISTWTEDMAGVSISDL